MNKTDVEECVVTGKTLNENELQVLNATTPKRVGIYGLQCRSTKKWYVGQSLDIGRRLFVDYRLLKCKNQPKLYFALRHYGYNDFDKIILEECDASTDTLDKLETKWIRHYDSYQNGYNCTEGGKSSRWLGMSIKDSIGRPRRTNSVESNKKRSDSLRKYYNTYSPKPRAKKHTDRIVESNFLFRERRRWIERL